MKRNNVENMNTGINETVNRRETAGNSESSEVTGEAVVQEKTAKTRWYKKPLVVKSGYMLIAVIVAMTLWGYVLMSENPPRTKRLENIPLSFESGSESDLAAKNLIILGDIHDILKDVSVEVKTTLNDLPRFTGTDSKDIVQASVSVRNVHEAGEYNLTITAVSTIGEVISVTPSYITVTVDKLISRPIPITYSFSGALPEGYWHGEPQLATATTTVKGAASVVDEIVRARCVIDLDDRTEPVNDSFMLTMYDKDINPVESANADTVFPSVIIRMDIRPTLDIKVNPDIRGQDRMNDIYEIVRLSIVPDTLTIASDRETLAQIRDLIVFDPPIDIADIAEESILQFEISASGLPENVLITGENKFIVTLEIRERIEERTFEDIPVTFINEDLGKYSYNYTDTVSAVTLSGRASIIRQLNSWDIKLTINLDGKTEGVFSLTPEIEFKEPELMQQVTYNISEINFEIEPAKH